MLPNLRGPPFLQNIQINKKNLHNLILNFTYVNITWKKMLYIHLKSYKNFDSIVDDEDDDVNVNLWLFWLCIVKFIFYLLLMLSSQTLLKFCCFYKFKYSNKNIKWLFIIVIVVVVVLGILWQNNKHQMLKDKKEKGNWNWSKMGDKQTHRFT